MYDSRINMNTQKTNHPKIREFTDLKVWQQGHQLVILIYKLTNKFPQKETYSLTDQLRRASVSITSNITEGFGRQTLKEKVQYYYQAQGSLIEVKNQIMIAKDVGYLPKTDFNSLYHQANITHQLLPGLITKTKSFIIHKS